MKRVTDRVSNPFGMRAPGGSAVYSYGDANADPADWWEGDAAALRERLEFIVDGDYRQTKGVATRVG